MGGTRGLVGDVRSPATDDLQRQVDRTRWRNERWWSGFLAVLAWGFFLWSTLQVLAGDDSAWTTQWVTAVYGTGYAFALAFGGREAPSALASAVRVVLETSVASLIVLIDARVSADYALPRASALLYALAIFATVLRLRPWLALLAGGVAAVQWLALWAWLAPLARTEVVQAEVSSAVGRAGLLAATGLLAWEVARQQQRLTLSVVTTALERERVRRAFGAYVAEPVVQRILSGDLEVASERRPITVMFVDIRGFTRFSESRTPVEVLDVLNRVLEAFSLEVQRHGGIVNKYLGDGLLALFGAPDARPDHATAGLRAALGVAAVARELGRAGVYPGLKVGVGVHAGEVVVGDVGGRGQREYTAIGDVVNVASRVEAVTKELGETVLVTEAALAASPEAFRARRIDAVRLRGRTQEVVLYALEVPAEGSLRSVHAAGDAEAEVEPAGARVESLDRGRLGG